MPSQILQEPTTMADLTTTRLPEPLKTAARQVTAEAASQQQASFRRFPDLPKELQLKIWKYAERNNNREVRVQIQYLSRDDSLSRNAIFKLKTPTPPTLHACQVSRTESLKSYFLCLKQPRSGTRCYYVNPVTDTLVLQMPTWLWTNTHADRGDTLTLHILKSVRCESLMLQMCLGGFSHNTLIGSPSPDPWVFGSSRMSISDCGMIILPPRADNPVTDAGQLFEILPKVVSWDAGLQGFLTFFKGSP